MEKIYSIRDIEGISKRQEKTKMIIDEIGKQIPTIIVEDTIMDTKSILHSILNNGYENFIYADFVEKLAEEDVEMSEEEIDKNIDNLIGSDHIWIEYDDELYGIINDAAQKE